MTTKEATEAGVDDDDDDNDAVRATCFCLTCRDFVTR